MIPELVQSWLVNMVLGMAMYVLVGVVWALGIYRVFRNTKYAPSPNQVPPGCSPAAPFQPYPLINIHLSPRAGCGT